MSRTQDIVDRFRALDERDQERILATHRDINVEHDWWDACYDNLVEDIEAKGFTVDTRVVRLVSGRTRDEPAIQFSGFWSQGDGASFDGWVKDWPQFLEDRPALQKMHQDGHGFQLSWKSNSRGYCHKHTLSFDEDPDLPNEYDIEYPEGSLRWHAEKQLIDDLEREWAAVVDEVKEQVHALCDDIYETLETEYEYLTSEEAVLDSLIANELLEDEVMEYEYEESL